MYPPGLNGARDQTYSYSTQRAYKKRLYPTPEQAELLARSFGCARFVWNDALRLRTDAYYQGSESLSHSTLEKRLVALKVEHLWLAEVSSVILQQTLRDQQQAFKNFWDKRARYPRFKSKHKRPSIRLTKAALRYRDGQLFIAKSKVALLVRWRRPLPRVWPIAPRLGRRWSDWNGGEG